MENIVSENKDKVVFKKEFSVNSNLEIELKKYVGCIQEIMLPNENLVFKVIDTEIDSKFGKNSDLDFKDEVELIKKVDLYKIEVELSIYKKDGKAIHVFDLNIFTDTINQMNIEEQLKYFQEIYDRKIVYIISRLTKVEMYTNSFAIIDYENYSNCGYIIKDNNRLETISFFNQNCNYISKLNLKLTPYDMIIYKICKCNDNILKLFERLSNWLSMIYILNISEYKNEYLEFKIFGYNTKTIKIYKDTEIKSSVLPAIFKWAYSNSSSISDKLGILRNVISLFLLNNEITEITDAVLNSCKSNYNIYLKENVEKYIEIKNNQQVMLNSIIDDISSTVNVFIERFKQNLSNTITFFFSVFLFNLISTGKINNIFTNEISALSVALLIISFLFGMISNKESMRELNMLKNKYERNKKSYLDIIDENDLNRILNDDKYFLDEKKQATKRLKEFYIYWIISITILLLVVLSCNSFAIIKILLDNVIKLIN
ncbi:MAG: hypothetical protein P1P64_04690 [Treponemataceae bacterium]